MNIFLTSFNQEESASHHDDLRLNKMILETAQLLSVAYRHLFSDTNILYKNTHQNHPCAIFAKRSIETYSWLVDHFNALDTERYNRFEQKSAKHHKSWVQLFDLFNAKKAESYKAITFSQEFFNFNCTPFKDERDVRIAYKKYFIEKWKNDKRKPTWKNAHPPDFWIKRELLL